LPAAHQIHLPAGRCVSTHSAQRHTVHITGCGPAVQISSQKTSGLQIRRMDYLVWGAMFEAYCKLKTNPKTIAELKESL